MTPQLLLIRHATTPLNDVSSEAIRGHSDIPISGKGQEGLEQTAKFLIEQKFHIKNILSSPLQRTMMSAMFIADKVGAKVTPNNSLLPWDLGKLTGQKIADVAPQMNHFQEYPDLKVPGGESYRAFYNRWTDALERMLVYAEAHPDEMLVGVVHSRNLLALPSILDGKRIGDVPVKGGPEPESVTRVFKEGDNWNHEVIFEIKI